MGWEFPQNFVPDLDTLCHKIILASHADVLRGSSLVSAPQTPKNVCVGGYIIMQKVDYYFMWLVFDV